MSPGKPVISGTFHIAEMEQWDEDYLNLMGQPLISFEPDGAGKLRFGAVQATLDYRSGTRDGKPAVEFSWEGVDEGDRVCGRGSAVLGTPDGPRGMLFFHMGDESGFAARRPRR